MIFSTIEFHRVHGKFPKGSLNKTIQIDQFEIFLLWIAACIPMRSIGRYKVQVVYQKPIVASE